MREVAATRAGGILVERTLALPIDCITDTKLASLERERLEQTCERLMRWAIDVFYYAAP